MSLILSGSDGLSDIDGSASTPAIRGTDANTGIFFPAADTIAFAEGGAEAMRIDSDGDVGIGTSSPSAKLTVAGGDVRIDTDDKGVIWGNNGIFGNNASDYVYIETVDIERARITSGGDLLVGTTSNISIAGVSANNCFVSGTNGRWTAGFRHSTASTPWGVAIEYSAAAPNDTSSNFLYCYDSTPALRMNVRSNGGIANYSGNNVNLSDRREKINFAPSKNYLDTICSIPVQTFNYIDQNMEEDAGLTLGVVAQDVQEVAPEFVSESNWGTQEEPKMRLSIYQTDLQYALMKCIQELKAELDTAKSRIAALEAK